jgi:hypothetical protein
MQIAQDDNEGNGNLTDADYDKEIDTLMELDTVHRFHFAKNRPSVADWMKRRQLYVEATDAEDLEEVYNEDKEQHFNSLQISLYVRDAAAF